MAAASLTVLRSDRGSSGLVERAAAAVDQPGQIEHTKSMSDGIVYETWSLEGKSSRTVVTLPDGRESVAFAGPICSVLGGGAPTATACVNTGRALSEALTSGEATVLGDGTVHGHQVKRVTFTAAESGISGIYEVDPNTLAPVRITMNIPKVPTLKGVSPQSETVIEDYSSFEHLPATPDNLSLLSSPIP